MPKDLKDFPRPPSDNGRGLHGSAAIGWAGGNEGYDFWIQELVAMGIKWFKLIDDGGDSILMCERLLAAGIFPIVRVLRKDPPPNDTPEPNPGHIGPAEEENIKRLVALGVRYFETNNEPNLGEEWKHGAMPPDPIETAKLVALNWLFDARLILEAGGLPALPAVSIGGEMDLMGALVSLGRQDILLDGCWIALHNYCLNHPLAYPDDPVNRSGQALTPQQYDMGPFTPWAWWNNDRGCPDTFESINNDRVRTQNPTSTILEDHSCFREFEYYDHLSVKYLGRSIPIISTEGGFLIGRREDPRYPRVTPDTHRDQTVAMYDFMQRQAPDYYFAATPWLLLESTGWETDAWNGNFWSKALKKGSDGRNGIPPIGIQGVELDKLPVTQAVKTMPSIARRLPGGRPALPPEQPPVVAQPAGKPASAESSMIRYVVVPGDSLTKIARRFGTSYTVIAEVNKIANPTLIRQGQVLFIPQPHVPAASPQPSAPPPESAPAKTAAPMRPTPPPAPEDVTSSQPAPAPTMPATPPPATVKPVTSPLSPASAKPTAPAWATSFASEPPSVAPNTETTLAPAAAHSADATPTSPLPLPPTPQPRMTPTGQPPAPPPIISPSLLFSSAPVPKLDWDPRLDAIHVAMEAANIAPGQIYWKLIQAEYLGPTESDNKHHLYFKVQDEQGQPVEYQRVWQGWPDDKTDATTNDQGEANIPLWASFAPDHEEMGPYSAWVDGLPSDRVTGLGLPQKRHVCFVLTWRRVLA